MSNIVHWGRYGAPCCSQTGYDIVVVTDMDRVTCKKCIRLILPRWLIN